MTDLENCQHELKKAADIIKRASRFINEFYAGYIIHYVRDVNDGTLKSLLDDYGLKLEKGRLKLRLTK